MNVMGSSNGSVGVGLAEAGLIQEDLLSSSNGSTEPDLDGFQEFANYFQFIVEGIAILIVGIIGVGINVIALGILFRKRVSLEPILSTKPPSLLKAQLVVLL